MYRRAGVKTALCLPSRGPTRLYVKDEFSLCSKNATLKGTMLIQFENGQGRPGFSRASLRSTHSELVCASIKILYNLI